MTRENWGTPLRSKMRFCLTIRGGCCPSGPLDSLRDFRLLKRPGRRGPFSTFLLITKARTKLRLIGLGYTDDKQSQQLRAFFAQGNKFSLKKLAQALVKDEAKKQQ